MGCCSSKDKDSINTIRKRPGQNDGGTGGVASGIDQGNDINEIVFELRPGDLSLKKGTPLKLYFNDDVSRMSSIPSQRNSNRRRYP